MLDGGVTCNRDIKAELSTSIAIKGRKHNIESLVRQVLSASTSSRRLADDNLFLWCEIDTASGCKKHIHDPVMTNGEGAMCFAVVEMNVTTVDVLL